MELVSIVIITYNSREYVIETLESAKNQSYQNIELIISDDCSTDDTVLKCKEWLDKNKNRFINTKIVTVKKNTGIAANCNRSINNATSDWVKFCAGDDLLLPNCIEDNMLFVTQQPDARIIFSQLYKFSDKFDLTNEYEKYPSKFPMNLMNPDFVAKDQYKVLLVADRITYTPSYFFNKKVVLSVGGYDESIQYVEDYPMWLKLTKAGVRLHFMEKITVGYRKHKNSLNAQQNEKLFSEQFLRIEPMRRKYVYPGLPWDIVGWHKFTFVISKVYDGVGLNNSKRINNFLYKMSILYLNPFQYVYSFKKHILGLKNRNIFYGD